MGMMMVSPRSDGVGAGGRPRPGRPEGLMPDLKSLNTICYMICIVCIVAGTLLGLGMIWVSSENPYIWKGLLTTFVLFAAAALTLSVNRAVAGRGGYMICIVCIVVGTLLGLGMIWVSSGNPYIWKGLPTIFVLFAAAALTLSVNRAVAGRGDGPGKPQPWTD